MAREKLVMVRVNDEEYEQLDRYAQSKGISKASVLRMLFTEKLAELRRG